MSLRPILLFSAAVLSLAWATALMLGARDGNAQPSEQRSAAAVTDERTAILLSGEEAAFVRREMRGLLESVREVIDAAAAGDKERVAAAARRAGLNGPEAEHIPKTLAPKLPAEFKKLGLATHRGFDQIALDVERSGTTERVPKQVVEVMGNCLACHATWRLVGDDGR